MKKLKNKVFFVIFGMLSIFLITILFVFQFQNYHEEKSRIVDALNRMKKPIGDRIDKDNIPIKTDEKDKMEMSSKIFMDLDVYTVLVHDNSYEILNHTGNNQNSDSILKYAKEIDINKKVINVGNLYTSLYSYSCNGKEIVIVDNLRIRNRLISSLETAIFLFVIIEVIILLLAKALTSWIIKPVILSFNKQKQFIADASHELKTPLAVIMANADALKNDKNEEKWLNNINEEANKMSYLITNLLDLARLDEVKDIQYTKFNLSKELEKSILTFESVVYEKKLHLNYDIEDEVYFLGETIEMKQLFSILMDNAIEHCMEKGNIYISLSKNKKNIILEFKNSGEGIPKGSEEKIFERFYRVDESHNRDSNHYGLGLAIAKGIVEKYHGTIIACSQNKNTSFIIKLKTISIS